MQLLLVSNRVYVNNQHSLQELQDNIYYLKRNCQFFNKRALTGGDRYFQKVRGLLRSSRSASPESPMQYCKLNFRTWTLRCQLCMQHSSCNSCCTQGHYQWDILQCDTLWTGVQDGGTQEKSTHAVGLTNSAKDDSPKHSYYCMLVI